MEAPTTCVWMRRVLPVLLALLSLVGTVKGAEPNTASSDPLVPLMTQEAIDRGLAYLAARQNDDGSFGTGRHGKNVGVVSLAGRAFLWSGSVPGEGKLRRDCDGCLLFILAQSQPDGSIAAKGDAGHGMMYGHALATSFLAEVYRQTKKDAVLTKLKPAVQLIVQSQNTAGSWRYFPGMTEGDVSVTACQILALRDARRAGLEVPDATLRKATEFVRKCQNLDGGFRYMLKAGPSGFARSAAAVGALAGVSNDGPDAIATGRRYLATFLPQGKLPREAWFSYGHYYAGWALWGADDAEWRRWHKAVCQELLAAQTSDGAWLDQEMGPEYATALACLTLQFPRVASELLDSRGPAAAVRAAHAAASPPVIRTQWEVMLELAIRGEEPATGTPAFVLALAAETAEKFGRLDPKAQNDSDLLTEHSRRLPDSAPGRIWLARQQKLHQEHWYGQLVDVYLADDVLAMAFVVFVPKPTQKPKVAETMYLIRQGDQWRVSLDIDADVKNLLGDGGKGQLAMLRAAGEKRLKELQAVVSRPLDAPLPFRGTWTSHFRQSGLFLCFNEAGEATTIVTRGNGTMSYSVCDYHVANGHIVIESHLGPVRLTLRRDQFWEHDGQRHYTLSVEDPRVWFPDAPKEILYLKPVYQGDWPVRRPVPNSQAQGEPNITPAQPQPAEPQPKATTAVPKRVHIFPAVTTGNDVRVACSAYGELIAVAQSRLTNSASAEESPIEIRVAAAQTQWEVNERTAHVLKITNRSDRPVTVPSFRFQNAKAEQPEIEFYLKEHILKMEVVRDSKPISIDEQRQARPEKPQPFPTVELQSKETVSVGFSRTLTEPGEYALTVTLDTTSVQGDQILKGRFASAPARFRMVPEQKKGTGPICAQHHAGRSGKLDLSPFSRTP